MQHIVVPDLNNHLDSHLVMGLDGQICDISCHNTAYCSEQDECY